MKEREREREGGSFVPLIGEKKRFVLLPAISF